MKPLFHLFSRVHLVGIGGVGMEGLARLLGALGCQISGSDRAASRAVEQLGQEGIVVHVGHRAAQVEGAELVVYSAAVPASNEELTAARALGIPAVSRGELLGELTRFYFTIGVAGSHGKTTTSSMAAAILRTAGWEPSVLIGGYLQGRVQAALGKGDVLVVEADEFQRSFLYLHPRVAVVTSIDAEHLDCYRDRQEVEEAFLQFLTRLPFYGYSVLCGDDPGIQHLLPCLRGEYLTYGLGAGSDFRAGDIRRHAWGSDFQLVFREQPLGQIHLQVPGEHNILNALAAAALAHSLEVESGPIQAGLLSFVGVGRRFERRGEVDGILVIDDYAHHPAELAATLSAARDSGRRMIAVFQPHLYSRTRALSGEFARVLQAADQVFLTAIYGSREEPLPGIHSGLIAQRMQQEGYGRVEYIPDTADLLARLLETCRAGDMVLMLGAGDIDQVTGALVAALASRSRGQGRI